MTKILAGTEYGPLASDDGLNFSAWPNANSGQTFVCRHLNGKYFAIPIGTAGHCFVYSSSGDLTNGSGWNVSEVYNSLYRDIAYGGGIYVAVGHGASIYSADGATWAQATIAGGAPGSRYACVHHGGKFIMAGSHYQFWDASDGAAWSLSDDCPSVGGLIGGIYAMASAFGRLFVAGHGGEILSSATTAGPWTSHGTDTGADVAGLSVCGAYLVATGANGSLRYSANGTDWTSATTGEYDWIRRCIFSRGRYIACSDSGKILESNNLASWSRRGVTPNYPIYDLIEAPIPFRLFGCEFQGFDRDATVTITRQIQVQESEGGSVTLIPTAPAQFDSWDIEVGLRVSAAQAQAIEASLPPYGAPSENALRLPPRGGGASFPGLLPLTPGETYDLYAYPMASPLDVQGRVAIGADLFSYRMSLRFFAAHRVASNTPTASSTTAPEWLTGKAIAHSVVDPSANVPTIRQATAGSKPLPAALDYDFHPTKQGRTNKRTITLDCLSQDRADELVGFFRGVRHNPTTITLDNGANGFEAISVYLTGLSFARGDGLYWTGSLEVVLA